MEVDPQFFYRVDPIAHAYFAMERWQDAVQRYRSAAEADGTSELRTGYLLCSSR